MSLFRRAHSYFVDLSSELLDTRDFGVCHLKTIQYLHDVKVIAFDPLAGLLAIGTSSGTVWLLGAPGVQECIKVTDHPLTYVEFASSISKLVCIDNTNRFSVWDLSQPQRPIRQASTKFNEPINCLTLSPSHAHAFVALQSGVIKTYDLLCLRLSPYVMPSLWKEYEKKLVASGTPSAEFELGSEGPSSVTIHPRDLNLIFICYGGAVMLADLKELSTIRMYEYILPAGAPGPGGYASPDLLKHRRSHPTAFAVHPTGHFFATGYVDGSIAFWAVEDEEKPLLVRTLEEIDINVVDGEKLSEALDRQNAKTQGVPLRPLEPIFKLSWSGYPNSSDPRGGATTLTILGGSRDEQQGVTVTVLLLPAFNPADLGETKSNSGLRPAIRKAMRESVIHSDLYTYDAPGVIHDYILMPHESPHFSGSFDPRAIIILSDGTTDVRSTDIWEFPPPIFNMCNSVRDKPRSPASESLGANSITDDLASTLEEMSVADDPRRLNSPPLLWNGSASITGGEIVKLEGDVYKSLMRPTQSSTEMNFGLRGGTSWIEDTEDEFRHAKFQPHRILLTHHRDLTIRFQDISAQLLISSHSSPVSTAFPHSLPSLTIDLVTVLSDPSVLPRCSSEDLQEGSINRVSIAPESLECAVLFKTGDVFVYKLDTDIHALDNITDKELLPLHHIQISSSLGYRPFFMIPSDRGPVSAIATSDIGLLAVAYNDGSLFIVDLRGPKIILRDLPSKPRSRISLIKDHGDPVMSLLWGIFKIGSDPISRIRLIATRTSGHAAVYTVSRESASAPFSDIAQPIALEGIAHPLVPVSSFVLESKTGTRGTASSARFLAALQAGSQKKAEDVFWISAGAKGVKCALNVDGERIARADWNSKVGRVESLQIVQRHSAYALVAFTNKQEMLVYSIPYLEPMHTLSIPRFTSGPLSIDETGDYVEWIINHGVVQQAHLGTLFSLRRQSIYMDHNCDLMANKKTLPQQPQPVSVGPATLFGQVFSYVGGQSTTGDQIDTILGGPDRPLPENQAAAKVASDRTTSASSLSSLSATASSGVSDLYSRLGAAISERGQMLDGLEDTVSSLRQGSSNMLAQAKKLAAEQATKRWFSLG